MTNRSDEVCERIIKAGLHADMLKNLSWDTLSAETLKESTAKRDFVQTQINILHNVVRRTDRIAGRTFRECDAVDIVQKFRDINEDQVIFLHPGTGPPTVMNVVVVLGLKY